MQYFPADNFNNFEHYLSRLDLVRQTSFLKFIEVILNYYSDIVKTMKPIKKNRTYLLVLN